MRRKQKSEMATREMMMASKGERERKA